MTDLTPRQDDGGTSLDAASAAMRCGYCGAELHSAFYFCVACGTPYKDSALVLSRALPPVVDEGELIRRKAPSVQPLFWSYVAVLVGAAVLARALFVERRPDLELAINEVALLIVTIVWARLHWRTLWAQLRRPGIHPASLIGLAALAPMLLVNYAYHGLLTGLSPDLLVDPLEDLRGMGLSESTLIAVFCVFPAVTEEIAYRGLVQHWLATAITPMRAMVLSSFLFAILHFSVLSLPYLFALGMLLGWVKWRTGSLYPCMLIHFLHNLIVIEFFAASG